LKNELTKAFEARKETTGNPAPSGKEEKPENV